MAYIVALTGGIGSGKSTVADMFARLGVPVTDADIIARQVVEPNARIAGYCRSLRYPDSGCRRHTGQSSTAPGDLCRPRGKTWLNQLLHPLIHQETRRQLNNITAPYALWVVPLLVENNLASLADRVLVVDVHPHEQVAGQCAVTAFPLSMPKIFCGRRHPVNNVWPLPMIS